MRQNTEDIQLKHRDEAPARMKADPQDRLSLRQKLAICIHPLKLQLNILNQLLLI